jgi:rhodanese-related sulfurtransferase
MVAAAMLPVPDTRAQESPLQVDGATTIDTSTAKALYDRGVLFVDVRPLELWEAGHIPGAEVLELFADFNQENLLKIANRDQEMVVYCEGPGCKRSSKACTKAVAWGFENIYYYREGYPAWRAIGNPTDPP